MLRPFSVALAASALALAASSCAAAPPAAKAPPESPEPPARSFCSAIKEVLATAPTFMGVADGKLQYRHDTSYRYGALTSETAFYGSTAITPGADDCTVFLHRHADENGLVLESDWGCIMSPPADAIPGCNYISGQLQFEDIMAEAETCLGDAWVVTKKDYGDPTRLETVVRDFSGPVDVPGLAGVRLRLAFRSDVCKTTIEISYKNF